MENFCGKCGCETDKKTGLCTNCDAAALEGVKESNAKKKISKKLIILPIILVSMIAIIIAGLSPMMHIIKRPSAEDNILYTNNAVNGNYAVVVDNELWYLSEPESEYIINKMKLPDNKSKEIITTDFFPEDLYVSGNKIYFNTGFMSGSIDSINSKLESTDGSSLNTVMPYYYDGYCYYEYLEKSGEHGLFVGKNETTGKKIIDVPPTRIIPFGKYVFFISEAGEYNNIENSWFGMWRMDKNGDNLTQILDYCPKYLVSDGNLIYYTNENDYLVSADMDGNIIKNYDIHISNGLNVKDGIIYYSDFNDEGIFSLDKNGEEKKIISGIVQGIILSDDYIVYFNGNEICCAEMDGSKIYNIINLDMYDYSRRYH